ncbi:MAG TPA: xylulokinase [Planctomycetota bacterium]|nr:xylulokinase [Planctomycetota bacterium]
MPAPDAPLHLGLDIGTQGAKALLLDAASGRVVARAGRAYGLIEGLPPGAAEQHPETWIVAAGEAAREVTATVAARVGGVGVSGQQHGAVVLDEQRRVVRPAKLWCDTSTAAEAAELSAAFGRAVPTGFTASKLLWLQRHEPRNWLAVRHVLLPHDYLNLRLTGRLTMEAGDASGTGLFDPVARAWRTDDAARLDARLPAMLPPLLQPGEPAGTLSAEGAALLGLRGGVVVASGSGDNMCSALGSGATRPGVVVLSLGTSGTVFTDSDRPVVDPAGLIAPFCDATGGWLPLLCVMNCTNVTEWVRAQTGLSLTALTAAADREPPGCGGLLWLPYLQGERVPDLPRATSLILAAGGAPLARGEARVLPPGRLFRSALEGVSLNLAWGVERMRSLGIAVDAVRVVGGGAQNPLWRQILADALDAPVAPLLEAESAALGAAILSAWTVRRRAGEAVTADAVAAPCVEVGTEVARPDPARVALYREAGTRFREAARAHFGAR